MTKEEYDSRLSHLRNMLDSRFLPLADYRTIVNNLQKEFRSQQVLVDLCPEDRPVEHIDDLWRYNTLRNPCHEIPLPTNDGDNMHSVEQTNDIAGINLVMFLKASHPGIDAFRFFKKNGVHLVPNINELFEANITTAVAVINDTPLFIGDKLHYNTINYRGPVILKSVEILDLSKLEVHYTFVSCLGQFTFTICFDQLHTFIGINKVAEYESVSYNGTSVRKIVLEQDAKHTVKFTGWKGDVYWADSHITATKVQGILQGVANDILNAIAQDKSIRVLIDSKPVHTIRKINT